MEINQITSKIIGCAIEVHKDLGAGLLESAYEECLFYQLISTTNLKVERQKAIPLIYKQVEMECAFRADFIIEDKVIVELKSVSEIHPIHKAQLNTYMKLTNSKVGLLINFNTVLLKNGIHRWII
ncbi:GxxExxY protein (plasmid) [Bernardetia sp. Wsw4-3y2]|uniref:GxxExxY protein n=1 Tax=unclassified Bernardetia TaxID=2647129 RepID=UPI0030D3B1E7